MMNKENIKGKLIVFEGLDGCFKETNSKLLANYIKMCFTEKVVLISYPNYECKSSFCVTSFLNKEYGNLNEVSPYTASLFYAVDRYHNKKIIDDYIEQGYTVILDRYVGSNIMYQSTKFDTEEDINSFVDWCTDLEYTKNGLRKEDITLFMYIPVELNYRNLKYRSAKAGVSNDIYESNKEYQLKLDKRHSFICDKLGWNIVKCYEDSGDKSSALPVILNKETIFCNVLAILNKYFQ